MDCERCPLGSYCPMNSSRPTFCKAGETCSNPARDPVPCALGYYASEGDLTCKACPAGMQCPSSLSPLACPRGSFSLEGHAFCTPCPAGFACCSTGCRNCSLEPGYSESAFESNVCSSDGGPCNVTGVPMCWKRCKAGTYSLGNQSHCLACPPGMECVDGINPRPCIPGWFSTGRVSTRYPSSLRYFAKRSQDDTNYRLLTDGTTQQQT